MGGSVRAEYRESNMQVSAACVVGIGRAHLGSFGNYRFSDALTLFILEERAKPRFWWSDCCRGKPLVSSSCKAAQLARVAIFTHQLGSPSRMLRRMNTSVVKGVQRISARWTWQCAAVVERLRYEVWLCFAVSSSAFVSHGRAFSDTSPFSSLHQV